MSYPQHRPRRLRQSAAWRKLVEETTLAAADLVQPLFAIPGRKRREAVPSMPEVQRMTPDLLAEEARRLQGLGVGAALLFGIPDPSEKNPLGSGAHDPDGVVPSAIRAMKEAAPDLLVWADVCLCHYTDPGHCGILDDRGRVDGDASLPILADAATVYAAAGADAVAPSDMMDGRVGAIRHALDRDGATNVPIVAYSAKFASAYYGPFRDAAHSAPRRGDRRSYQMDPANAAEALLEVGLDLEEGADVVMVKPAGPYLDVIARVKSEFGVPTAAYQVSGEYSLIRAAGANGWVDERAVALESLVGIRRAGADIVVTYYAADAARWLSGEGG